MYLFLYVYVSLIVPIPVIVNFLLSQRALTASTVDNWVSFTFCSVSLFICITLLETDAAPFINLAFFLSLKSEQKMNSVYVVRHGITKIMVQTASYIHIPEFPYQMLLKQISPGLCIKRAQKGQESGEGKERCWGLVVGEERIVEKSWRLKTSLLKSPLEGHPGVLPQWFRYK